MSRFPLLAALLLSAAPLLAGDAVRLAAPAPGGDRIVNGLATSEYPSTVAILEAGSGLESCTGTLVGCRTVLTAAHCVCRTAGTACQAGGSDLVAPERLLVFAQHGGLATVAAIDVHPAYVFAERSDVAVLHLSQPLAGIPPAAINELAAAGSGLEGTIVGFGLARGDREASGGLKREGRIVTRSCLGVPDAPHVCWSFLPPLGEPGTHSNTCLGDSGGPLFLDLGAGPVLAGVTSGGDSEDCLPPDEAWDAEVFFDRDWIRAAAGADLGTASCGDLPAAGGADAPVFAAEGDLTGGARERDFIVEVPPGARLLRVALNGEEGPPQAPHDLDLYVRALVPATTGDFDCASQLEGVYEICQVENPQAGPWHVLVDRFASGGPFQVTATVFDGEPVVDGACVADATTLCVDDVVGDRRFEVKVGFETAGGGGRSGDGQAIPLSPLAIRRGGLFWFFDVTNPELLIKVLDGCAVNGHHWVFWSAGTDVGLEVRVRDTATSRVRTYTSRDGQAAEPVVDVEAFPCP